MICGICATAADGRRPQSEHCATEPGPACDCQHRPYINPTPAPPAGPDHDTPGGTAMTETPAHDPRREVLEAKFLEAIDVPPYLSTACDTAHRLEVAATRTADREFAAELEAEAARLHERCRLVHKFTGTSCDCPHHRIKGRS